MTNSDVQATESGLTPGQIFSLLLAQKRTILLTIIIAFIGTGLLTISLPKTYTASTDIYIDHPTSDPITGRQFHPMFDESYMQTQMDMIKGQEVANYLIDNLRLTQSAEFKTIAKKIGVDKARASLIHEITSNIQVSSLNKASRVLEVKYSSNSPERAKDFANALIQSYLKLTQQLSLSTARTRQEQYNLQLEQLSNEITQIQEKLTDYQQTTGILDVTEQNDIQTKQLIDQTNKLVSLRAERQQAEIKQHSIEKLLKNGIRPEEISEISDQQNITHLKSNLIDVEKQLADLSEVLGKNHPRIISLQVTHQSINNKLNREAYTALETIKTHASILYEQEKMIQQDIDLIKSNLLEIKKHRDVIYSYQRQMEGVQKVYNSALQKYDELLMSSTINLPKLTVLRTAEAPSTHSKPQLKANLIASVGFGLFIGMALALLLEFNKRRLRTHEDLERGISLPLLGKIGMSN
jgi:polysaccharide biosynthesis transport protein